MNDLHARSGGFCAENNMKVIFKVGDSRELVKSYQLEHRSGARINIVEDGIVDEKYDDEDSVRSGTVNIIFLWTLYTLIVMISS